MRQRKPVSALPAPSIEEVGKVNEELVGTGQELEKTMAFLRARIAIQHLDNDEARLVLLALAAYRGFHL